MQKERSIKFMQKVLYCIVQSNEPGLVYSIVNKKHWSEFKISVILPINKLNIHCSVKLFDKVTTCVFIKGGDHQFCLDNFTTIVNKRARSNTASRTFANT